jgi:hypothetical protein
MLIGVEEEFIIVSASNFFYTPAAPKVLLSLLFKDRRYLSKSSLETPLTGGRIPKTKKDFVRGFAIVETKTSPHKDIDSLKEEIIFHRNNLVEAVVDCDLALLPSGIHPFFSPKTSGIENCAALHIHLDKSKKNYSNILTSIPLIIALTANSPFVAGNFLAMCSRALYSPSVGIPNNFYERNSDLIINKNLNTIELRVCDTQILPEDVIGLVATLECIVKLNDTAKIAKSRYNIQRKNAIYKGKKGVDTTAFLEDIRSMSEELSLNDYIQNFFTRKTGAEWQCECLNDYGFSTLLTSLWESMKKGRYNIKRSNNSIDTEIKEAKDIWYLLPYSPFLILNILKKIRQDDAVQTTDLFGRDPKKNIGESLYEK